LESPELISVISPAPIIQVASIIAPSFHSHVIFDAVFLPRRKWLGDFARTEISGIKSFVQCDHSLSTQPFMELEDISET
jgi:hypothetical protein